MCKKEEPPDGKVLMYSTVRMLFFFVKNRILLSRVTKNDIR